MAVKERKGKKKSKVSALRLTMPRDLMTEVRGMKKACQEHGLVFDLRPDVERAVRQALLEAQRHVAEKENAA